MYLGMPMYMYVYMYVRWPPRALEAGRGTVANKRVCFHGRLFAVGCFQVPWLPAMAVVAQPVCMRFSQREVHAQWQRLRAAATQFLQPIGMFDSGNASDGAATRAVLQLRECSSSRLRTIWRSR